MACGSAQYDENGVMLAPIPDITGIIIKMLGVYESLALSTVSDSWREALMRCSLNQRGNRRSCYIGDRQVHYGCCHKGKFLDGVLGDFDQCGIEILGANDAGLFATEHWRLCDCRLQCAESTNAQ